MNTERLCGANPKMLGECVMSKRSRNGTGLIFDRIGSET